MADNITVTPGSGTSIAADDIGTILHQRVKVVLGADGVSDGDVSSANPMPVVASALGGVTASLYTGQKAIAVTGTQARLTSSSTVLTNGATVQASANNVAEVTIGLTGVTNTADGTGNGKVLQPGQAWAFAVNNLNLLYINGTAGDWVDWSAS